jgi:hypothetical protein
MRELRTATIVANEVSMLRAGMRGPIVLVEGDSDTRLYRKFMLPTPHVRLTHCDGKPVLIETMELLRERGIRQVFGICDADFDRIVGQAAQPDVLRADLHDAEMMIVYSPSFRHVCDELYGTTLSDRTFQKRRDELLEVAACIGSARMWNNTNQARLNFKAVEPGGYLRGDEGFDYTAYASKLLEESANDSISLQNILQIMRNSRGGVSNGEMASGHDFAALLDRDAAIKGERNCYGHDVVEKMLRLSFDVNSFGGTELVLNLRRWEQREDADVLIDELSS